MNKRKSALVASLFSILVIFGIILSLGVNVFGKREGEDQLTALKSLSLVDVSIDADSKVSRMNALYSLLSVMGLSEEARTYTGDCPFYDVLDNQIGYAYEKGLVIGGGFDRFMPYESMQTDDMLLMCLRAIGYSITSITITANDIHREAENTGIYAYDDSDDLLFYMNGAQLGEILWNMLGVTMPESNVTFAENLISLGIITADDYESAVKNVQYAFGKKNRAVTDAVTEEIETETTGRETEPPKPDDPWGPIWRP